MTDQTDQPEEPEEPGEPGSRLRTLTRPIRPAVPIDELKDLSVLFSHPDKTPDTEDTGQGTPDNAGHEPDKGTDTPDSAKDSAGNEPDSPDEAHDSDSTTPDQPSNEPDKDTSAPDSTKDTPDKDKDTSADKPNRWRLRRNNYRDMTPDNRPPLPDTVTEPRQALWDWLRDRSPKQRMLARATAATALGTYVYGVPWTVEDWINNVDREISDTDTMDPLFGLIPNVDTTLTGQDLTELIGTAIPFGLAFAGAFVLSFIPFLRYYPSIFRTLHFLAVQAPFLSGFGGILLYLAHNGDTP